MPQHTYLSIENAKPDPNNARTHTSDQIAEVARSIETFGYTNPVLFDEVVRAGNCRVAAVRSIYAAGRTIYHAPGGEAGGAAIPDGHIPFIDCSGWSEAQRRAYALADNKLALNAGWDEDRLRAEIDVLTAMGFDVAITGFGKDDLDALTAEIDGMTRESPDDFPEFGEDIETAHECPKCGYKWSGKSS